MNEISEKVTGDMLSNVQMAEKRLKIINGEEDYGLPSGHPALVDIARAKKIAEQVTPKKAKRGVSKKESSKVDKEKKMLFLERLLNESESLDKQLRILFDVSKDGLRNFSDDRKMFVVLSKINRLSMAFHSGLGECCRQFSHYSVEE